MLESLSRGVGVADAPSGRRVAGPVVLDREGLARLRAQIRDRLMALKADLGHLMSERSGYLALFPIVVCIDEIVMTRYVDLDRGDWVPFQRDLFQTDEGGDLFYTTIDDLLETDQPSIIFEIFYFCLRIGFGGRHAGDRARIGSYMKRLAARFEVPPTAGAPPIVEEPFGTVVFARIRWLYYGAAVLALLVLYGVLGSLAAAGP
jgi:type VI secretion system protein ImpK